MYLRQTNRPNCTRASCDCRKERGSCRCSLDQKFAQQPNFRVRLKWVFPRSFLGLQQFFFLWPIRVGMHVRMVPGLSIEGFEDCGQLCAIRALRMAAGVTGTVDGFGALLVFIGGSQWALLSPRQIAVLARHVWRWCLWGRIERKKLYSSGAYHRRLCRILGRGGGRCPTDVFKFGSPVPEGSSA
ncbi:hypothetical protein BJ322DRAFT_1077765 [Thelephora terrestris]|uniref:Uncharacterized protein n=1 Tax=Thelephora terrestris TaxID=56493 RepID=A0A9P6H8H1_9AGAM|nr:hypothetical protein BJ322DRAFT_1077765 [Thelephora terrestris]